MGIDKTHMHTHILVGNIIVKHTHILVWKYVSYKLTYRHIYEHGNTCLTGTHTNIYVYIWCIYTRIHTYTPICTGKGIYR